MYNSSKEIIIRRNSLNPAVPMPLEPVKEGFLDNDPSHFYLIHPVLVSSVRFFLSLFLASSALTVTIVSVSQSSLVWKVLPSIDNYLDLILSTIELCLFKQFSMLTRLISSIIPTSCSSISIHMYLAVTTHKSNIQSLTAVLSQLIHIFEGLAIALLAIPISHHSGKHENCRKTICKNYIIQTYCTLLQCLMKTPCSSDRPLFTSFSVSPFGCSANYTSFGLVVVFFS